MVTEDIKFLIDNAQEGKGSMLKSSVFQLFTNLSDFYEIFDGGDV